MLESGRRLTSWKEIAAHFGRDVRTVMRWEKERGLPVHRGPNGRTGVVIADTTELDAWARGVETPQAIAATAQAPELAETDAATRPWPPKPWLRRLGRRRLGEVGRWTIAAIVLSATAIGLGGWRAHVSRSNGHPERAVLTEGAVIALNPDGTERWRHQFPGEHVSPPFSRLSNPIEPIAGEGLLAGTSYSITTDHLTIRSGLLMWFDPGGTLRQSFAFQDNLRIGGRDFAGPWSITDYRQRGSGASRTIAVTAHHYEWWPSIVTILDSRWQRRGSFAHAGWIEQLRWLSDDRLAVAGFSNVKDAGMVAVLDANALDGQSPSPANSEFDCAACGPNRPVKYVTLPRSEVNRATGSPFNRASLSVREGALLVNTVERPYTGAAPATALYEFTSQLTLVHASYTDRYWEAHRELERLGKIRHTREQCPEREGPTHVEVWNPAAGWTVHTVHRIASR